MVVLNVLLSVILSGTVQAADWSSAADLITARKYHTATLLLNGRVLVVGGKGLTGTLASAELYDPATNKWSSAGNLSAARLFHSATLLPNGLVLVVGGEFIPGTLASAELYDPATNSWSSAGTMIDSRSSHSATLLSNGRVLVAGGIHEYGNSGSSYTLAGAELYDPATNSWSAADSLVTARYGQSATLLPDGRVLVAGVGSVFQVTKEGALLRLPARNSMIQKLTHGRPLTACPLLAAPAQTCCPTAGFLSQGVMVPSCTILRPKAGRLPTIRQLSEINTAQPCYSTNVSWWQGVRIQQKINLPVPNCTGDRNRPAKPSSRGSFYNRP